MKDEQIQNALAKMMLGGTLIAALVIAVGLLWFLAAHSGAKPGDHLFSGEPKYFENPIAMVERAMAFDETGHRRSLIMIGVVLLLLNPMIRVALAVLGFAVQKDRLYAAVSLWVLLVLVFSFFW
jgi:uncharacterized membrane protein